MGRELTTGAILLLSAALAACQIDPARPAANHHPVRPIRVILSNPSAIPFVLSAYYRATDPSPRCRDKESADRPAYVEEPIPLEPINAPAYQGRIFGDRYIPGKCGWAIGAIFMTVKRQGDPKAFDPARDTSWAVGFAHGRGDPAEPRELSSQPTIYSQSRCDPSAGTCASVELPWVADSWGGDPDTVLIYLNPA